MREIKFRAWDKQDKRMYEWPFIVHHFDHEIRVNRDNKLTYVPMEDVCLMLFTGLKDKFGKEIYEGDIVKDLTAWMGYNPFFEVKYFVNDREKANPLYGDVGYNISSGSIYEIIGNIYENPELIGGGNEIKG